MGRAKGSATKRLASMSLSSFHKSVVSNPSKIIASGVVRYTTNVTHKGIVVRTDTIENYKATSKKQTSVSTLISWRKIRQRK